MAKSLKFNQVKDFSYSTSYIMFCNRRLCVPIWWACVCFFLHVFDAKAQTISGQLMKWHRVTLTFSGASTCENSVPNPFTDYRLTVTFSNGNKTYVVPGYFAANGSAGNSGASCGSKWRVH